MFSFPFPSLPENREYEFNLNWILKKVKDLNDQYIETLPQLVSKYVDDYLTDFQLEYIADTETIKLKGVIVSE